MARTVNIARSIPELQVAQGGRRGAFVPTMGALHEGHLALIRRALELASPVIVSIFVNPTQFGPNEDFSRYPRTLESDIALATDAGAKIAFAPDVQTIYPPAAASPVPELPGVATGPGLEDAHRPGHFAGVCQVVARLFDLVQPALAVFGEKDYQQLLVISAMVKQQSERWPGLQIVPHATVREPDGLAMSSRNRYLKPEQRDRALGLWRALTAAQARLDADAESLELTMCAILKEHRLAIEYAVVRDAATLERGDDTRRPRRALIAARLEAVRLIDNVALPATRGTGDLC
jgi:pantoate--beta-alanine ligase